MSARSSHRIVLTTIGSLGDLHPYLALAIALRGRGHDVLLATQKSYGCRIEAHGIGFHAVGPDIAELGDESALMARVMHPRKGPAFIIRDMLIPRLRRTFDELSSAVAGADLLVSHPLTIAAPLVAQLNEKRLAWISAVLAPSSFCSAYDPPVLPALPVLTRLHPLGATLLKPMIGAMKAGVDSWVTPWHRLRRELRLPPTKLNPLFRGQFSPLMTLALFSNVVGKPQPDWPPRTHITGFLFYEGDGPGGLAPQLSAFLHDGEAPIVFTLGSSAVMDAGNFYHQSAEAARLISHRAVLLIGKDPRNRPRHPLPSSIFVAEYAPYSLLFSHAGAIVHQGGIGTTAQALRSGKPMIVMPFGFDQPDNAARMVKLGVGRTIARRRYCAQRASDELTQLLGDKKYSDRAAAIGQIIQQEDGAQRACVAIEECLARHRRS